MYIKQRLRKIQIGVIVHQAHSLNSKMIFLRSVGFLAFLVLVAEARTYISRHQLLAEEPVIVQSGISEVSLLTGTQAGNHEHKRDIPIGDRPQDEPTLAIEPPSRDQAALLARYIVNQADWSVMATISAREGIAGYPTAGLISHSDGPLGSGSGIPYFYLTPRDFIAMDLNKDDRATLLMSLAQGEYCRKKEMDPMDPRCARVMLTGRVKAVSSESTEHEVATSAFFGRHPKLVGMPPSHRFFLAKLEIMSISILGAFGGPKHLTTEEYLNPPVKSVTDENVTVGPVTLSE